VKDNLLHYTLNKNHMTAMKKRSIQRKAG